MNLRGVSFLKNSIFVLSCASSMVFALDEGSPIGQCIRHLENISLNSVHVEKKTWTGVYSNSLYRSKPKPLIELTVPCDTKRESVSQCKARASRETQSAYPDRDDIRFIEQADAVGVQAVMTVDGKSITKVFESNAAVTAYMKQLQNQGKDVNLTSLTQVNNKNNVMILAQSEKPTMEVQGVFDSKEKIFNPSVHMQGLFAEVTQQGFELLQIDLGKTEGNELPPLTFKVTCAGLPVD